MTEFSAFDRFDVGDHVVFEHSFAAESFEAFSALSGDRNPYHHDASYAAGQGGMPIVPLHMTLAPMSAIAGMDFPGEPSLYLGHEVRAVRPVHYGDTITYSGRIQTINASHRVLTVRVLGLREDEVVLDAIMRTQARYEDWDFTPLHEIRSGRQKTALVTGASGDIGQAIAVALARSGWRLLLQDRGASERRSLLAQALEREHAVFEFVTADLSRESDLESLVAIVRTRTDLDVIVHAASPPVLASATEHVTVGYLALKALGEAAIAGMLKRQSGTIILVGTSATETAIRGWEDYSSAKAMSGQLVRSFDRLFGDYGVTGHILAPGLVSTRFSEAFRSEQDRALVPAQVGSALVELINSRTDFPRDMLLTPFKQARGRFGFHEGSARIARPDAMISTPPGKYTHTASPPPLETAETIVRSVLRLPADLDLANAGLGATPGWDSLKHIEIVLAIEAASGIRFTAAEVEETHQLADLSRLLTRKVSDGAA